MNRNIVKGVIVLLIAIVIFAVIKIMKKKKDNKEGYSEVMIAPDYNDFTITRPTFKANLSPRFDPHRMGGGYIKSKYPTADLQGAGPTPMSDSEGFRDSRSERFSDERTNREGFAAEIPIPGELNFEVDSATGSPIPQEYANLNYRAMGLDEEEEESFGKACAISGGSNSMEFKSAQGYADPEQLLPAPDMRSCLKDPADPLNYMYDRTIFAPLKRRNAGNYADYIRGDLNITPINTGWFNVPVIPSVDLVKGAMSILNGPSIDDQDTIYQRARPLLTPQAEDQMEIDKATLPGGDIGWHMP